MSYREETLANGKSFKIGGGGVHFICHYATAEIEFRVILSGNVGGWVPLDRGIGWQTRWDEIEIRNLTGSSQTVGVVYHSEQGYFDNRELAAQVALNGVDVQVVNSPYVGQGGVVRQQPSSRYSVYHDATGGVITEDIITAVANPNGVRVSLMQVDITTAAAGKGVLIRSGNNNIPILYAKDAGVHYLRDIWEFDANQRIYVEVGVGVIGYVTVAYDIL